MTQNTTPLASDPAEGLKSSKRLSRQECQAELLTNGLPEGELPTDRDELDVDEFLGLLEAVNLESGPEPSSLLGKAYESFCRQIEQGNSVDPDEYCAKFPAVKSSLFRLLQVHNFFEEHGDLLEAPKESDWPTVGQTFSGFHLEQELGRGAFSRVFSAAEPAIGNRKVVVKVAFQGVSEELAIQGPLHHANVVPIYSVAKDPQTRLTAVCMPYRGRATLCHVLDLAFQSDSPPTSAEVITKAIQDPRRADFSTSEGEGTPKPDESSSIDPTWSYGQGIRYIAVELAKGLAFIHGQGIRHQDLKPSNILLTPDGTPQLLDFNLSADDKAVANRLGGTLAYMSPEQLRATDPTRNEPPRLGTSSDLFSYGVILYELLTGQHPFGRLSAKLKTEELREILERRHQQEVKPIEELRTDIDRNFAEVIHQCLAVNPEDRPKSAAEIITRLERPEEKPKPKWKWLVALSLLVSLAIGSGMAFSQLYVPSSDLVAQGNPETEGVEPSKQPIDDEVIGNEEVTGKPEVTPSASKQPSKEKVVPQKLTPKEIYKNVKRLQNQERWSPAAGKYGELRKHYEETHNFERARNCLLCQVYCLHRAFNQFEPETREELRDKENDRLFILDKYMKAVKDKVQSPILCYNLGWFESKCGKYARAIYYFDLAIALAKKANKSEVPLFAAYFRKAQVCYILANQRPEDEKWDWTLYENDPVVPPFLPRNKTLCKEDVTEMVLRKGFAAIESAIRAIPDPADVTYPELYLLRCHFSALYQQKSHPEELETTRTYIREAIEHGVSRKTIERSDLFKKIQKVTPKNVWEGVLAGQDRTKSQAKVPKLIDPTATMDF
ncbi:MAG: serine/threonine protein kinase [Gemmataceae bacterium]